MKRRRSVIVAAVCAVATLGVAGPAYAFWSVGSSSATGSAKADLLGAPTASAAASGSTIVVTVSAKPATGPTPSGYRVDRTAPTTAAGVCAITGSTGSCTDSSPGAGANTYAVYAKVGTNWVAASAATASASTDSTAPTTTITFPAAGGSYNATTWTGAITGTATDNVAVAKTEVAIRNSAGNYWNGSAFSGSTVTWITATNGAGSAWSYAFARPADGSYTVQARSTDTNGNVSTPVSASFSISTAPANVTVSAGGYTNPVNSVNASTASASGTTDAGSTVSVTVTDGASHSVTKAATVSGTSWSVTGLVLTTLNDGPITYTATATNGAGNTGTASVTATKDVVAPTLVSVSSGAGSTPNKMETGDTLVLTFSEAMDTSSVGSSVTVTEKRSGNSSNVTLSVPGLIADAGINTAYVTSASSATATAASSTITWSSGNTVATVTLGPVTGAVSQGTGGVTVAPATTLKDANGNAAAATPTRSTTSLF